MTSRTSQPPQIVPVDDEHAEMIAYALSENGQEKIAEAQAEIDAGRGLVADDAYFEGLKERRSRRRASRWSSVRRIVFAPSFDAELFEISISIEQRFGVRAADEFETRIRISRQEGLARASEPAPSPRIPAC